MTNQHDPRLSALTPEKRKLLELMLKKKQQQGYQPFSLIDAADKEKLPDTVEDAFPIGVVQLGMMFHMNKIRDVDTPPDYHNVSTFIFKFADTFQLDVMQQAVDKLVEHEPMFRTAFDVNRYQQPLQLVYKQAQLSVTYEDLRELDAESQDQRLKEWIAQENFNVMDLGVPPLVKLHVHQFSRQRIAFSLIEPHSISDGWSTHLNMIDIFNLYFAILEGSEYPLSENPVTYAEFIQAEQNIIKSEETKAYWEQVLQNCSVTELPLKAPLDVEIKIGEHRHDEYLPEEILINLNKVVKEAGVPLKSVLLAAHARFLSLLTGQKRITTGLNFNGRLETKGGINSRGLFLNTLPVTLSLEVDSWIELAKQVYQAEIAVLPHRNYPLGVLQGEYGKRNIFDTAFSFLHFHSIANDDLSRNGKIECEEVIDYSKTNFDFNSVFNLHPTDINKLEHKHDANLDRFSPAQLKSFFTFYELILKDIGDNPHADPNRLDFLTQDKRELLVHQYNHTQAKYRSETPLHVLFEQQVLATPDAVAVDCAHTHQSLSYTELNQRANKIATALMARGVGHGDKVLVILPRSIDVIATLLAILKTGAAYVPVDPGAPVERINSIVSISAAKVAVGKGIALTGLDADWFDLDTQESGNWSDTNPDITVSMTDTCYVLFTSGSTGQPKGVMVPHRGVVNYLSWARKTYSVTPNDIMPLYTSLAFDLTVTTLFMPLLSGACIRVFDAEEASTLLNQIVADGGLTLIKMTPAHLGVVKNLDIAQWQVDRFIVGGEQLTTALARDIVEVLPNSVKIFNEYGPTEASVGCMTQVFDPMMHTGNAVPIGKPADNVRIYVLDERHHPVLEGIKGELYIAGDGLALGYLNDAERTAQTFVDDPFYPGEKMYRTGDLARRFHDGSIEFIARIDNQTKLRGFRIELGEIESQISRLENVEHVAVLVRQIKDQPQLVAYIVPTQTDDPLNASLQQTFLNQIKSFLSQFLPNYMVPNHYAFLTEVPLTTNGKMDRDALPELEEYQVQRTEYKEPKNQTEKVLLGIWKTLLQSENISVEDSFFDIGGSSVLSFQLVVKIREEVGCDISVTDVFEYPTIRSMSVHIQRTQDQFTDDEEDELLSDHGVDEPIAIVGIAGRFPDADDVDQFWDNLKKGHESIQWYSDEALKKAGVPEALVQHRQYVKSGNGLAQIRQFDADYFGFTPREAQLMDPQQRLLFEVATEALDDAGYGDAAKPRNVGVFVGVGESFYFLHNLATDRELIQTLGMEVQFGNGRDFAATRLSHRLNLTGPAMTVATACSTSLVAIHQAAVALLNNECRMAIAGGSKAGQLGPQGYLYQEGGILSPDGHCRAFDAEASGTRSGDGCGLVVLKRLSDAINDGDQIHAVLKGSALNNDGSSKVGYTAPSISGQVKVIKRALHNAGIAPDTVSYVEAHGTGTALGDPIEVKALNRAYAGGEVGTVALGSVKSNVGHLDSAAGVASVIKTVMSFKHGQIPPSINFDAPNPTIEFEAGPFFVNHALRPWAHNDIPRRAGISSFGIGGTNVHMVLEEAPQRAQVSDDIDNTHLITLSARSPEALEAYKARLVKHLQSNNHTSLADMAYTLRVGRTAHQYRDAIAVNDVKQLQQAWGKNKTGNSASSGKNYAPAAEDPVVVFMFPGQGSQYAGAAADLYREEPRFAKLFDQCAELFKPELGVDIRKFLERDENQTVQVNQTHYAQAIIFSYSWSLARLLMQMDANPDAMIGHSIGEYVAATIAGVMSLHQAIRIISTRGKLMHTAPKGYMVSVALSEAELQSIVQDIGAEIAAVNAPQSSVLSVTPDKLDALTQRLQQEKADFRVLHTSHAFHSSMMETAVEPFVKTFDGLQFNAPEIPFMSNVSGDYANEDVMTGSYWGRHLRSAVRFNDGLDKLLKDNKCHDVILFELGPGTSLNMLARKQPDMQNVKVLSSIRHSNEQVNDYQYWLTSVGNYWKAGGKLDRAEITEQAAHRISLPSYPFQRKEYWIEPTENPSLVLDTGSKAAAPEKCFYQSHWQMQSVKRLARLDTNPQSLWLIVTDDSPLSGALLDILKRREQSVIEVAHGEAFSQQGAQVFVVNPDSAGDYAQVVQALAEQQMLPERVIHCAGLIPAEVHLSKDSVRESQIRSGQSARYLMQALMGSLSVEQLRASLVSANTLRVTGNEIINPASATMTGLALVASQEYPGVSCQLLDVAVSPAMNADIFNHYAESILGEFDLTEPPFKVALRDRQRWVQHYLPYDEEISVTAYPCRENGVYVITGGLGNIGLTLARALAERYQAKLMLIGRNAIPPQELWDEFIEQNPTDPLVPKIKQLQAIKSKAGELAVTVADVASATQMEEVLSAVEAQFGQINGVIHAAGQVHGSVIPLGNLTDADVEQQFLAKVNGLVSLEKVLANRAPDFVVCMSSLSTVLGGLGFTAYAAANAFMDSFVAAKHNQGDDRWLSINWDGWNFERPNANESADGQAPGFGNKDNYSVTPVQGVSAFFHALKVADAPQLIHSTGNLQSRLDKWINASVNTSTSTTLGSDAHDRPDLDVDYVAPEGEVEQRLVEIWQQLLGINQIGVLDSFFELGGDSLLVTRVIAAIRHEFKVPEQNLSINAFFENPTIRQMAEIISDQHSSAEVKIQELEEAGKVIEEGEF